MVLNQDIIIIYLVILAFSGLWGIPVSGNKIYYFDYFINFLIVIVIWFERTIFLIKPIWPSFKICIIIILCSISLLTLINFLYLFQFTFDINEYFYEPKKFTPIENLYLRIFDLTIGIALVAVTEEFIFRYKLNSWLQNRSYGYNSRLMITSLIFSLMHAPQGIVAIGITFIWGVYFFKIYEHTKSLLFTSVIHFLITFYYFVSV